MKSNIGDTTNSTRVKIIHKWIGLTGETREKRYTAHSYLEHKVKKEIKKMITKMMASKHQKGVHSQIRTEPKLRNNMAGSLQKEVTPPE